MINDWGFLSRNRRPYPIETEESLDKVVSVPVQKITNSDIRLLEEIWEEYYA